MEDAEQVDWFPVFRSLIRRPTVWWKGEGWACKPRVGCSDPRKGDATGRDRSHVVPHARLEFSVPILHSSSYG